MDSSVFTPCYQWIGGSSERRRAFPQRVTIILICWHLLLLEASVAVRGRQMSSFLISFSFFVPLLLLLMRRAVSSPTGLQRWDQAGAAEGALPAQRFWGVEQGEERAGEERTTGIHNIHAVKYSFHLKWILLRRLHWKFVGFSVRLKRANYRAPVSKLEPKPVQYIPYDIRPIYSDLRKFPSHCAHNYIIRHFPPVSVNINSWWVAPDSWMAQVTTGVIVIAHVDKELFGFLVV